MLTENEIIQFIQDDASSSRKRFAKVGERYYDGDHDIKKLRFFYFNKDGILVEDRSRSNVKIPHVFFMELVDQATQYILSSDESFIISDNTELQPHLDTYFNNNEQFKAELSELITGVQVKGFEYMYRYKNKDGLTAFQCADGMGVIEVRAEYAEDKQPHVIYWYTDRIDKGKTKIKRIQVWDVNQVTYYTQKNDAAIELDKSLEHNPAPHSIFQVDDDNEKLYGESFDDIPFFRIDNNKKQFSNLKAIKDIIDDYDIMDSSLSNNLIDFDTPLYVVRGFEGDDLSQLQQNIKTIKMIGLDEDGNSGVDIKTVDIPYEARKTKLELDEKNIYRFGFGLNTQGLKDTSATTNIAIKAAYSLLDLRCSKLEIRLKQFLQKLVEVVIDEINENNKTEYRVSDVKIKFKHEIMSNAQENAQIELTDAQKIQTLISTLITVSEMLDNETIVKKICDVLDIDYEEIKSKLPDQADDELNQAQNNLDGDVID